MVKKKFHLPTEATHLLLSKNSGLPLLKNEIKFLHGDIDFPQGTPPTLLPVYRTRG